MPGLLKATSTLNPMAAEFKLNPTAVEFVPGIGIGQGFLGAALSTTSTLKNRTELCDDTSRQASSTGDQDIPSSNAEVADRPIPLLTPFPKVSENNISYGRVDTINSANSEDSQVQQVVGLGKACCTKALPKIVSGENLADMELEFDDMFMAAPCDGPAPSSSPDDINPLQDWCGDEPPKLVWSRSADIELSPDQAVEYPAMDQNESQEHICSNQNSASETDLAPEKAHEKKSEVQDRKSKVTVDDFEILCKVGEVRDDFMISRPCKAPV